MCFMLCLVFSEEKSPRGLDYYEQEQKFKFNNLILSNYSSFYLMCNIHNVLGALSAQALSTEAWTSPYLNEVLSTVGPSALICAADGRTKHMTVW